MPYSNKNQRRLTGYRGETSSSNSSLVQLDYDEDSDEHIRDYNTGHQQATDIYNDYNDYNDHDSHTDDFTDHRQKQQQQRADNHSYAATAEATNQQEDEEYDVLDEDEDDDSGSELSIPDPDIDFDMVYALHTFAATVDGQASVVRGDALTLLDDTNSYWWLIKVLKTAEVGYIPAENIETPYERLARLNSHRNIELTRKDIQDAFPTPPSNKAKKQKRVTLAKDVRFQSQIIYGSFSDEEDDYYRENGDDDDDDNDDDYFESEFQQWNERMRSDDEDDIVDSPELIHSAHSSEDYRYSMEDPYQHYYNEAYGQQYQQQGQLQQASAAAAEKIEIDENGSAIDKPDVAPTFVNQAPTSSAVSQHPEQQQQQQQQQQAHNYHYEQRFSMESESINNDSRESFDLEKNETIKISLTPSIARGEGDDRTTALHTEAQARLKKAAKFEKLLSESEEAVADDSKSTGGKNSSKKEKSGIRKLFSRDSSNKEKKKEKKKNKESKKTAAAAAAAASNNNPRSSLLSSSSLERLSSTASTLETASLESQSNSIASIDPALIQPRSGLDTHNSYLSNTGPKRLKINAGNTTEFDGHTYVDVYPTTTAQELIERLTATPSQMALENVSHQHEYYLIVKSQSGDELTLVPSDKPLEIYQSLTSHLNTPMPSLRKARRISQLMEGGHVHLGGPQSATENSNNEESAVQFFLYHKTKRMDEGEIQIKVSLLYPTSADNNTVDQKRMDKMVRVPAIISAKDAVTLLLEKFHILNGVAVTAADVDETIKSLRLEKENEVVPYVLSIHQPDGTESMLGSEQRLLEAYQENQVPHILYRRSSNPDRRSSVTVNITPPEKHEVYFILKPVQNDIVNNKTQTDGIHEKDCRQSSSPSEPARSHRIVRQNTPMPRHGSSSVTYTDMYPEQTSPSPSMYQPQVVLEDEEAAQQPKYNAEPLLASSPDEDQHLFFDAKTTNLANSPTNASSEEPTLLSDTPTTTNTIDTTTTSITMSPSPDTPTPSPYPAPAVPKHDYSYPISESLSLAADAPTVSSNSNRKAARLEPDDALLFCEDFGINDLMVLIRGAARSTMNQPQQRHKSSVIQTDINDIFSDSQAKLDQLEKELDRIMAEAVKIYA